MKTNTVTIGTEEYYQLRQFKEKMIDEEIAAVTCDGFDSVQYVTKDNAITVLGRKYEEKRKETNSMGLKLYNAEIIIDKHELREREEKSQKVFYNKIYLLGAVTVGIILGVWIGKLIEQMTY